MNKASTDASFLAYSSRITHLEKDKSLHASEIQDQGSRITRMEIQASANDDSIHRLDTRLSNLETNITADQAANHEFNNTMSQLVMDILVKEETIQLQQARLNALESERGVDRGNIQTLNETIIRIESDLYLDIGNSQSQIELLNNSTRTLETNMTIQIVTIQDHSARLGQLETKMEPAAGINPNKPNGFSRPYHLDESTFTYTVRDQKYFHNIGISIDFNVFSCLEENLLCY